MRLLLLPLLSLTSLGLAQSPTHIQPGNSPFATAVWAGNTLYVSGQIASPASGDTKTQAFSVFSNPHPLRRNSAPRSRTTRVWHRESNPHSRR